MYVCLSDYVSVSLSIVVSLLEREVETDSTDQPQRPQPNSTTHPHPTHATQYTRIDPFSCVSQIVSAVTCSDRSVHPVQFGEWGESRTDTCSDTQHSPTNQSTKKVSTTSAPWKLYDWGAFYGRSLRFIDCDASLAVSIDPKAQSFVRLRVSENFTISISNES